MHEGAVCTEIMDIVSKAAQANGLKRIQDIFLTVGPYSCLNLGQLNIYFEIARQKTCMENAVIHMETDETLTGSRQMFIKSICGQ